MKNILTLGLLISGTLISAQSFEWNDKPVTSHPKEVVTANVAGDRVSSDQQTGLAGIYSSADEGSRTAYGETYRGTEMTGSHADLPLGTLLRVTNPANGRTVVVRVTDRGRECADCLVTLSASAASELGINGPSSIGLERSGFSNWNPLPPSSADRKSPATANLFTAQRELKPAPGIVAPKTKPATTVERAPQPSVFTREVSVDGLAYNDGVTAAPSPSVRSQQQARGATAVAQPIAVPTVGSYSVQLAAYTNEAYALRRISELKEKGLTEVFYRSVTKSDGQVINRVYVGNYSSADDAQAAVRSIQGRFDLAGIVAKM